MSSARMHDSPDDIAIVGMAGRFPGAGNIERYWQNLREGVSSISFFAEQELKSAGVDQALLENPNYVKAGAVLENIDLFDAHFFGFTSREAELMDPQQRFFLECAWETLEEGGYDPENYSGRIGVYAGQSLNGYMLSVYSHLEVTDSAGLFQMLIGNEKDHLPTRVSYKLNLKGPSINVQTACSTSLVAVAMACQGLLDYRCDMALAGGVSIRVPSKRGYLFQEGGILSPDGVCRAFDAKSQGTVSGDGVGAVLLKRLPDALADGDNINAVIKGTAINNDGSAKVGYTAPSIDGQAAVIAEALAIANIEPETIAYVEAHGTGTRLGDPIEIAALTRAFRHRTEKKGFCAVGSVKTNIGHLDAAAGVAGLIKAVLALKHRMLPPSLNFDEPNPHINFASSPFYVNTKLSEWAASSTPRRAGVSSFGIGGTNAHAVLEEAAPIVASPSSRSAHLLVLSARTQSALETASKNLSAHLRNNRNLNLADVAYTLQIGRRAFSQRRAHLCTNLANALAALETPGNQKHATEFAEREGPGVVMMFPGQGSQHVKMAQGVYESEPVFRQHVDHCAQLLEGQLALDLRSILFPQPTRVEWAEEQLNQTSITQPALFVVEYALAKLWIEWGVRPVAMIGHSVGEYVAACLAGTFSLEDALSVVTERGRSMQSLPMGAMLAVFLSEGEITARVKRHTQLSIAAHNALTAQVVSGPLPAVARLERELTDERIHCRRLRTSHAFHSAMMEPMMAAFAAQLQRVSLNAPQLPYVSNVTGKWITASEATKPDYWVKHLRQPVRFAEGIAELLKEAGHIMLEVGPGRTLSSLVRPDDESPTPPLVLNSLAEQHNSSDAGSSDVTSLLNSLGQLWAAGVQIDWPAFNHGQHRRRLSLPTYPFERRRYWIEPRSGVGGLSEPPVIIREQKRKATGAGFAQRLPDPPRIEKAIAQVALASDYIAPANDLEESIAGIWREVLGLERVSMQDNFFELGGNSLIGLQLMTRLRKVFLMDLPINVLFDSPTVPGLAANIADSQRRADEVKEIEQTLLNIEGLSDAEVRAILLQDLALEGK